MVLFSIVKVQLNHQNGAIFDCKLVLFLFAKNITFTHGRKDGLVNVSLLDLYQAAQHYQNKIARVKSEEL